MQPRAGNVGANSWVAYEWLDACGTGATVRNSTAIRFQYRRYTGRNIAYAKA